MNINLKRAIVGSALLFSMGMANAATNIGTLNPSGYFALGTPAPGVFSDIYNFNLVAPNTNVGGDAQNILVNLLSTTWKDICGLSLTVDLLPSQGTTFAGVLSEGSHSFTVAGTAHGTAGGMYAFSAAAVPEPGTWAMMLGGIGLIGFLSYRRRQYSSGPGFQGSSSSYALS